MKTVTLFASRVLPGLIIAIGVPTAPAGNLPLPPGKAETPETRTLTAEEADRVLQRDWLFQAMGEPLPDRAAQEIVWTRELADRLSRRRHAPDLSAELTELKRLEIHLAELRTGRRR